MNWFDLVIILFLAYFLVVGFFRGFIRQFLDLLAIIFAFVLAFLFYQQIGQLLSMVVNLPKSFANIAGFFVIWFLVEFVYYFINILFYDRIPEEIRKSKWNKMTGMIPAFFRGIITLWVILGLILIPPIPTYYRDSISNSLLGKQFIESSKTIKKHVGNIFGDAIEDTIEFLTIKPESSESIDLGFKTTDVTIDAVSENRMLELINQERRSQGLMLLKMDPKLQEVAREHSKDMFARGYFAHNTPEGLTPFDRMDEAGIKRLFAGENLALATDVLIAHDGLMKSKGHRENILTPDFEKVGIGVIDGGKYGKMFSQEFTD